jgi:DNA polymerase I-like protein with 3'-5' exonuclease and polymerase domains
VVKTEYWDKGVDTCDIPWPTLSEYAAHDAAVTLACYHAQLEELTPAQRVLVSLMSQDMLILQEMEATGILFDGELCKEKSIEIEHEIESITKELTLIYPNVPINFGSGDQLSAFLYGGTVCEDTKEHVGFFKTGAKAGQPKYSNVVVEHSLPRLFNPVQNTLVAKSKANPDGPQYWETNEGVLKKLKGKNKFIVEKLLRLSKLEKLNGTYYQGLPKLNEEMHWPAGMLHGQFNQTLAATGRLSSKKPNQQNFASELQNIFISIYE